MVEAESRETLRGGAVSVQFRLVSTGERLDREKEMVYVAIIWSLGKEFIESSQVM